VAASPLPEGVPAGARSGAAGLRGCQTAARPPKPAKLAVNPRLQQYVQEWLSGHLQRPDGSPAAGPTTTWKGLNKPHCADRRWATTWSPEQISRRLVVDFPDDADAHQP
jgi:hypothetical protein